MARISTRHKGREKEFKFDNFYRGLTYDLGHGNMGTPYLYACKNISYRVRNTPDGQRVVLAKRRGVSVLSASAVPGSGTDLYIRYPMYYSHAGKYVFATDSKVYYLNTSTYEPVEVGSVSGVTGFTEYNDKLIIYGSSGVEVWDDSTLSELHKTVEDYDIGDGDGSTTNFTGTLPVQAPSDGVLASSVTMSFINGGTTYTVTDDGSGNLTGDVNGGGTNTITYSTGAYDVTFSPAPDNLTDITVDYTIDNGAPRVTNGCVRQGRLYAWGQSTFENRLYYTSANDETGWDTSTGGGYVDVGDSGAITAVIPFYDSMLIFKRNEVYRLSSFPGESDFAVAPLMSTIGCSAGDSLLYDGRLVSFVGNGQWNAIEATQRYGDIQKGLRLDKEMDFGLSAYAKTAYNLVDDELWMVNGAQSAYVEVLSVGTGGQYTRYYFGDRFLVTGLYFNETEMLVGASDGYLYRYNSDANSYRDNGTDYDTHIKSGVVDFGLPGVGKYNKEITIDVWAPLGFSADFDIYKYPGAEHVHDVSIAMTGGIYDPITERNRFNYNSLWWELTNIQGNGSSVELSGVIFKSAIVGLKNMDFTARDISPLTFGGYSVLLGGERGVM